MTAPASDSPSTFPQWLQQCAVEDAQFQRAYESLPAVRRSWLKRCIAQLCDHHGLGLATAVSERGHSVRHGSGLLQRGVERPLDWSLVLLDEAAASPARLLATVLPPLLAGVRELVVLRLAARRAPWPPALLAALELAGVEQVYQCPATACGDLFEHLAGGAQPGAILCPAPLQRLSRQAWLTLAQSPLLRLWQPEQPRRAGLYAPDLGVCPWQFDVLDWSQPGLELELWTEDTGGGLDVSLALPQDWHPRRGDPAVFLAQGYELVYAPAEMHDEALRQAQLVLGPGEEGCWVWPDLGPGLFRRTAAAWDLADATVRENAPFFGHGANEE